MDAVQPLILFFYTLPALITGAIAYFLFKGHIDNEKDRREQELKNNAKKESFPLRLQAYERMTLFLERISPSKLLIRVAPISDNKNDYESLLVNSIEQEFEHNLAQQIYVTDECWQVINTAKNSTIQLIRKANMSDKTDSSDKLREVVLNETMERIPPSYAALSFIKSEVGKMW